AACLDLESQAPERKRRLERTAQPVCDRKRLVRALHPPVEHGELVAAQPGHGIRGGEALDQPLSDLLEEEISTLVPEGVVDLLEAIEVDEQDGQPVPALLDGLLDA